jgi:hypothetical protein
LEYTSANTFFWRSRTIVIVADPETGIIVTGGTKPALTEPVETEPAATKPAGPEVNILLDAANDISLLRVGEEFGAVIGECSKEFWTRVKKVLDENTLKMKSALKEQEDRNEEEGGKGKKTGKGKTAINVIVTDKQRQQIMSQKPDLRIYKQIPSSTKDRIMCSAFNEQFARKPPCMRCRWIYDEWYLHREYLSNSEDARRLKAEWKRGLFKIDFKNGIVSCNYCAETVAAAKLYALRQGAMSRTSRH